MLDVIMRQISLNGVRSYTWSNCELGMRYISEGKLRLDHFITHEFPLEQWREAFDLLIAGKGHETGQTIGDDVLPFDDVEQASVAVAALDGRLA